MKRKVIVVVIACVIVAIIAVGLCLRSCVAIIAVGLCLRSCGNKDKPNENTTEMADTAGTKPAQAEERDGVKQIAFYDFDKKIISSQTVDKVADVKPPKEIDVPYGYVFTGWDKNPDGITDSTRINADFQDIHDKENALFINSATAEKDDKVRLTMKLGGKVDLCGVSMSIKYDKSVLKLENISKEDAAVMAEHNEEDGTVSFNLVSGENITGDVDLFDMEFKVLTDETAVTELTLENIEVVRLDDKNNIVPVNYYPVNGTVYIF